MEDRIREVFFRDGDVGIVNQQGVERVLPLEMFPALYYARAEERSNYYLWDDNRSIRWESLDEDIHISNFDEPQVVNFDNEVNSLLSLFPILDLKAFADYIDIHWTLLARLRFGVVPVSPAMLARIKSAIHSIGEQMVKLA